MQLKKDSNGANKNGYKKFTSENVVANSSGT